MICAPMSLAELAENVEFCHQASQNAFVKLIVQEREGQFADLTDSFIKATAIYIAWLASKAFISVQSSTTILATRIFSKN